MKKSKLFTSLIVLLAAISMTSCNRGSGCPGQDLKIDTAKVIVGQVLAIDDVTGLLK